MAVWTITRPTLPRRETDYVQGSRRVRVRDVAWVSGNYTTGGETIVSTTADGLTQAQRLARAVGLYSTVENITGHLKDATGTILLPIEYDRTNSKLQVFESGAANAPLAEKGSAEVFPSGTTGRLTFTGT